MATESEASATWEGTIERGSGTMSPAHAEKIPFSLPTRFEGERGSNPEELLGAAFAGCFSMALSKELGEAGATPNRIATSAQVTMATDGGFEITAIALRTEVDASGVDQAKLDEVAQATKKGCPVGKALASVERLTVEAKLAA